VPGDVHGEAYTNRAGWDIEPRKPQTRRDRLRAKLKDVKDKLRLRRHQPIPQLGTWLGQVVKGFFNFHAVPTNFAALAAFRRHVTRLWLRALLRRGNRDRTTWEKMRRLADDFLPKPRISHPWPDQRFAVTHPRWKPYAGKPHIRFCAGGAQ